MRIARVVVILLGCLLHAYVYLFESKGDLNPGLSFYALIPYAVAALLGPFRAMAPAALGFALGTLAGDIYMYHQVFVSPKGPMAGYGLLIMPILNLLLLGPAGALLVWLCARFISRPSEEDAA